MPVTPTLTAGDIVRRNQPELPEGLTFDTATGEISGTPTELMATSMYTITGTNTGDSTTAYVNITIVDN